MSDGLTTWDAASNVQMSTDDFTYQIMHSAVYTPPVTVNIADFDPGKCTAVILPIDPVDAIEQDLARSALPVMALAPGVISINNKNSMGSISSGPTSLRFRLLVMRFAL